MPIWVRFLIKAVILLLTAFLSFRTGAEVEKATRPIRAFEILRDYLQGKKPAPAPAPATPSFWDRIKPASDAKEPPPLTDSEFLELQKILVEQRKSNAS